MLHVSFLVCDRVSSLLTIDILVIHIVNYILLSAKSEVVMQLLIVAVREVIS
jgi:hypothetical protein